MIYVDQLRRHAYVPGLGRESCHLTADSVEELHQAAGRLHLRLAWFQASSHPHYDLTPAKRSEAVRLGASEGVKLL